MGRTKKEFNRDGPFQTRFRDLYNKSAKTQETLARELGVSRPTLAGWLDGKSIPDILALERIARLFGVSADYLLGISDTESPDVGVRASVAYTGLSEDAVKWLHVGLDDFECDGEGISETEKEQNLRTAAELIQSRFFTDIVHRLRRVAEEAYLEEILTILSAEYCNCGSPEEDADFSFRSEADREIVKTNLIHAFTTELPWEKDGIIERVHAMDDETLAYNVTRALISARDENELQQFHAAKAFTGYLDQLVEESCKRAEQRFVPK